MTPKRMSTLVCSFGWISVATLMMGSAGADQTAFIGVNVIPVDGDRVLEDYSVIVEDGRIVAMGPRVSTSPDAEATLIEGEGKYLIPGIHDRGDPKGRPDSTYREHALPVSRQRCHHGPSHGGVSRIVGASRRYRAG